MSMQPLFNAWRRLACACVLAAVPALLPAGPWQPLFNGTDLGGWKQLGGAAPYTVQDGAIVGTTIADTPNSFLATERTYGDFILEFEVKQEVAPTNTGVQFRSLSTPDYNKGRVHGYQCEIDPSERAWTGGIYDEARRGWLYPGTLNPAARDAYQFGRWNHFRIEAIGPSLRTWVNGVAVAHVVDDLTKEGFIALQVHAISRDGRPGSRILWRNLRIQTSELTPSPDDGIFIRDTMPNRLSDAEKAQGWRLLWDGATTAGWRGANGKEPAGWKIEHGELVVHSGAAPGGRVDLVTEASYAAFELQFDFLIGPAGNSGVKYYVVEPGGAPLGLEFQILDDEKHPDAKLGAAGNRTTASLYDLIPRETPPNGLGIAPKAGAWQHGRIVARADGQVEHWLNGVRLVEYNRRSRLLAALVARSKYEKIEKFGLADSGPILLQDHGDEARFRSVKIRELR